MNGAAFSIKMMTSSFQRHPYIAHLKLSNEKTIVGTYPFACDHFRSKQHEYPTEQLAWKFRRVAPI